MKIPGYEFNAAEGLLQTDLLKNLLNILERLKKEGLECGHCIIFQLSCFVSRRCENIPNGKRQKDKIKTTTGSR